VRIEDLKVSHISRSAMGALAEPDSNVQQKAGLNAISDQAWAEYRRQLEYKMRWAEGRVIAVPAINTSRRCPCCGHAFEDKTQADFEYGYAANADYVASRFILAAGFAVYACRGVAEPRLPSKQEPSKIAALPRW
jgi:putative transposase